MASKRRPTPEDQYFERIERHFGLRRGGLLVLSPRDWQLVQRWQAEGIPATVVMRGINQAFDRHQASRRPGNRVNSLSYCRQHVEECWAEHRELAAAEASGPPDLDHAGPADHLAAVAARCRMHAESAGAPAARALERVAGDLEALAAGCRDGSLAVREVDARARALETTLREIVPSLFEAPKGAVAPLPRFSPWAA
jgi:hypothetical protein